MVWQRPSRADCAKHILTLPRVTLPKIQQFMAQEVAVFFFLSNANGMSFPWNHPISPWCELSASTASCWQVLQLSCVSSEKTHLLFFLLGLPTANFDILSFLYWNRQGTIKPTHFLHVTHFIQLCKSPLSCQSLKIPHIVWLFLPSSSHLL